MDTLERAFEPYRHVDPVGWIGVYRFLPASAGVGLAVLGAFLILFGGRRLFRLVAGPLGALLAAVWAGTLATRLGFGSVQRQATVVSTFALLGAGFLFPPSSSSWPSACRWASWLGSWPGRLIGSWGSRRG